MRPISDLSPRVVASGLRFPEGSIAMADGSVLLVEVARGTLSRVRPDGAVYVCNNGGFRWHEGRHGLLPLGQADDYGGGRIERVDHSTGEACVLYDAGPNGPLKGPNDIVFDRAGGMWFTDLGKARAARRARAKWTAAGCTTRASTAARSAKRSTRC